MGDAAYGHMPEELREAIVRVSDVTLNREIHERFAIFAGHHRHAKTMAMSTQLVGLQTISWTRWFGKMSTTKGLAQWKAKGLSVGVPIGAVVAVRTITGLGRLVFITLIHKSPLGSAFISEPRPREDFIPVTAATFMDA